MRFIHLLFLLPFFSTVLAAQPSGESTLPIIQLTDSVNCTVVKDQSQSSTCWVFGTNSLFESDLIKTQGTTFNLSEMFIARYAWIDKAKKYLATNGRTYFAGGGQFRDVLRVVNNYGMVPEDAYSGKPGGEKNHDHHKLDIAMKRFVNGLLEKGKKEFSIKELQQMNDTLDRYLGKIPSTFIYNGQTYTPKTFAQKVIHFTDDYVEVMSFSDLPLYKKCFLDDKYNWAGDSLYNISLSDLQMLVDTALAKGWSVGWEGDVTETGFAFYSGFATLPERRYQFDDERLVNYKNESTERDHMLHLVGIGKDEKDKKWYYLKNSWGRWFSKFDGFMYMSEDYFKLKTVIMMVNKEALPIALKIKLGIE